MLSSNRHLHRFVVLLSLLCLLLSSLSLTSCKKKQLDYLKDDLSPYLLLPENKYLGHTIAVEAEEISELDIQNAILQTRAAYKNKTPEHNGAYLLNHEISAGDVVYLFYTPYYYNDAGVRVDCYGASTSNLASSGGISPVNQTPASLEIGSGEFATGFELGLVGKNPKDYAKFDYSDLGKIKSDDTLFITYTAFRTTESDVYEEKTACIRPDDTNMEELYGIGFWDRITSFDIGITQNNLELPLPAGEGEAILYSSIRVDFVRHASDLPTLTVEAHFPASYDYDLFAGKKIFFECFVQKCVEYTAPEIDEDFILNTLGMIPDDLASYSGSTLEKYQGFLRDMLEEDRRANAVAEAEIKMWAYLRDVADLISYPEKEIDRIYRENYNKLEEYYADYSAQYDALDLFAIDYFGLEAGDDWQAYMLSQTQSEVKERLILYTIMRDQNILPTDDQYRKYYDDFFREVVAYHADSWGIKRSLYSTDEEYETALKSVNREVLDYYGEEYFTESAYYQFAGYRILSLFRVTLNGEPLAIPID